MAKGSGDEADEGQAKTSVVRSEPVVAAAMAEVAHSRAASKLVAPVKRIVCNGIPEFVTCLV